MNKSFIKKYGTLLLLAAGAGIIFQLPYIRETFYVPIQNAMNLTDAQMGMLSSGYATMATFFILSAVLSQINSLHVSCLHFHLSQLVSLDYGSQPSQVITSAA